MKIMESQLYRDDFILVLFFEKLIA